MFQPAITERRWHGALEFHKLHTYKEISRLPGCTERQDSNLQILCGISLREPRTRPVLSSPGFTICLRSEVRCRARSTLCTKKKERKMSELHCGSRGARYGSRTRPFCLGSRRTTDIRILQVWAEWRILPIWRIKMELTFFIKILGSTTVAFTREVLHGLPKRIGSGVSRPTVCLDYAKIRSPSLRMLIAAFISRS